MEVMVVTKVVMLLPFRFVMLDMPQPLPLSMPCCNEPRHWQGRLSGLAPA